MAKLCRTWLIRLIYKDFKTFWYLAYPKTFKLDFLMEGQEFMFSVIPVKALYAAIVEIKRIEEPFTTLKGKYRKRIHRRKVRAKCS